MIAARYWMNRMEESRMIRLLSGIALLAAASGACVAQEFPTKPVHVIVPFPPGGVDVIARPLVTKMSDSLGRPVVMENRAGANGIIGSELVMRAAPDGYTLLVTTSSTLVTSRFLSKNVPFHPQKDFTPIGAMYESVQLVAVRADLPVNSIKELVDYAKRNPGKLTYASSGIGSAFHMLGEAFKQVAGVDILHVPYKGTGPVAVAIVAGQVDMAFPSFGNLAGNVSKVKVLAITDPKRYSKYPDIPTLAEQLPGVRRTPGWIALFGPAGMQRPIVNRLNNAMLAALRTPEIKDVLARNDSIDIGSSPDELAGLVSEGLEIAAEMTKRLGIKPE
jgi:tripartite-type tricarboxylate transporter receptor subunit TctC